MIRGISFQIPQMTTNTLWEFLRDIDIKRYFWYIISDQSEVWDEFHKKDFFDRDLYNGFDFFNLIQTNHYIIFLKLQMFLELCNFKNLHTYDDFINNDCKLILLVYDCEYVEIYSKNIATIDAIYQRAKANGYNNIEYITDMNDGRTKMDIL